MSKDSTSGFFSKTFMTSLVHILGDKAPYRGNQCRALWNRLSTLDQSLEVILRKDPVLVR
jgi:hypothetical protein